MSHIISISRESGSSGREFGLQLFQSLGFAYYDKEISKHTSLAERYVQNIMEYRSVKPLSITVGIRFLTAGTAYYLV